MNFGQLAEEAVSKGAMQQPREFAALLEAVAGVAEGKGLLEIGCGLGGTLYAWREIMDKVLGVSLEQPSHYGATVMLADSHELATLDAVNEHAPFDALFIDGDHSYYGASLDWQMYAPLVRAGGIVAFHDINMIGPGTVWRAVSRGHEGRCEEYNDDPACPYGWGIGVLWI